MKRNLLLIILALLMSLTISNKVFAYENDYIKVKIKSNPTASLSSEGFQIGVWDKGFYTLFNINERKLIARIDGYFINSFGNYIKTKEAYLASIGPYHVKTDKRFYSYEEAFYEVEMLRGSGIDAFIYYNSGDFQICIGQFINENKAIEEAVRYTNDYNVSTDIIRDNGDRIVLSDINNEIILMFDIKDNIHLSPIDYQGGLIKVEDSKYRDYITFYVKDEELVVTNNIKIQHYLYGVVPKEMYPGWPLEALKAQAVAAKNYALLNINNHIGEGYNLCSTEHCQVYGGYDAENTMTNRAVDETVGRILTYNDQLVNTYYHSSSGGHTENSENVWSGSLPYLRGIPDDFSLDSPYDYWQFIISKEEISERLLERGIDVGEITGIEVISTSQSGRVQELLIKGIYKNEILKKERIRQVFGSNNIKSTWFEVDTHGSNGNLSLKDVYIFDMNKGEIVKQKLNSFNVIFNEGLQKIDNSSNIKSIVITDGEKSYEISNMNNINMTDNYGKYVFSGRGWGHGVGMSQWGAKKMAELGYNFEDILEYYFTGAIVK